jgi:hypothetical protein
MATWPGICYSAYGIKGLVTLTGPREGSRACHTCVRISQGATTKQVRSQETEQALGKCLHWGSGWSTQTEDMGVGSHWCVWESQVRVEKNKKGNWQKQTVSHWCTCGLVLGAALFIGMLKHQENRKLWKCTMPCQDLGVIRRSTPETPSFTKLQNHILILKSITEKWTSKLTLTQNFQNYLHSTYFLPFS